MKCLLFSAVLLSLNVSVCIGGQGSEPASTGKPRVIRKPGMKLLLSSHGFALAFSPDGTTLAAGTIGGDLSVWDLRTAMRDPRFVKSKELDAPVHCVVFSPDGTALAALGDYNYFDVLDVSSGRPLKQIKGQYVDNAFSMVFSPDSKTLAAAGCSVGLWDLTTGRARWLRKAHRGNGYSQAFSPDGRLLAWGARDGSIRLIDTRTLKESYRLTGHQEMVRSLVFTTDGRSLISAALDNTLRVWELATRSERHRIDGVRVRSYPNDYDHCPVTISRDGRFLAAADNDRLIYLWDVRSGKEILRIEGHRDDVYVLALSGDGSTLASAGRDKQVFVWNLNGRITERRRTVGLARDELEGFWRDLAGSDAHSAYRAIRALIFAANQSVPFLEEQLKQEPVAIDPKRITALIKDLDSNRYRVRQNATRELWKLGKVTLPALEKMLAGSPSLEAQARGELLRARLTQQVSPPRDVLRALRAVEVLESAGTSTAREALKRLATDAPRPDVQRIAQAAYKRLAIKR